MFSRASHWLVTRFPVLRWLVNYFPAPCTDWLHVFPRLAQTSCMFSFILHWLVTCFPALWTDCFIFSRVFHLLSVSKASDRLHVFPRFTLIGYVRSLRWALSGYLFSRTWHWVVTSFFNLNVFLFLYYLHWQLHLQAYLLDKLILKNTRQIIK